MFKQERISKANIEIETADRIYYSTKESLKFNDNKYCIEFYNLNQEYNSTHCGEYTIKYTK